MTSKQVYDTEHGYCPQFISGNYYNYHIVKHERAKRPKNGKVKTYKLADIERAAAAKQRAIETKDARRAARQATRQAARQALHAETVARYRDMKQPKKQAAASAARQVFEYSLELGSNPYNLASIHV